ncbi:hypothetical protein ACF0H5_001372 [Mactra antiquata]
MTTELFSPSGSSLNLTGPSVHLDSESVITMKVRRFTYGTSYYTLLACIDISNPQQIFYTFKSSHLTETEARYTEGGERYLMANLMNKFPVPREKYEEVEENLKEEVNRKMLQLIEDRIKSLEQEKTRDIKLNKTQVKDDKKEVKKDQEVQKNESKNLTVIWRKNRRRKNKHKKRKVHQAIMNTTVGEESATKKTDDIVPKTDDIMPIIKKGLDADVCIDMSGCMLDFIVRSENKIRQLLHWVNMYEISRACSAIMHYMKYMVESQLLVLPIEYYDNASVLAGRRSYVSRLDVDVCIDISDFIVSSENKTRRLCYLVNMYDISRVCIAITKYVKHMVECQQLILPIQYYENNAVVLDGRRRYVCNTVQDFQTYNGGTKLCIKNAHRSPLLVATPDCEIDNGFIVICFNSSFRSPPLFAKSVYGQIHRDKTGLCSISPHQSHLLAFAACGEIAYGGTELCCSTSRQSLLSDTKLCSNSSHRYPLLAGTDNGEIYPGGTARCINGSHRSPLLAVTANGDAEIIHVYGVSGSDVNYDENSVNEVDSDIDVDGSYNKGGDDDNDAAHQTADFTVVDNQLERMYDGIAMYIDDINGDDDDGGWMGGIMGIYCRSGMHVDYSVQTDLRRNDSISDCNTVADYLTINEGKKIKTCHSIYSC